MRFSAIIYNHDAFPLLLGRRVLHKLKILINWELGKWYMKTGERTKVQIHINFDTNYVIRRIAASNSISEDKSEMEEVTSTSETASNTEDYSDHEIYIFQQDAPDNVNLIADTSEGNIQILTRGPEISTTSKTSKEDLIKAIAISISKVPLKYAEHIPELWELCMEFIDIFEINYEDLKISNVLQFDIDTGDASPIYCKPYSLPCKHK